MENQMLCWLRGLQFPVQVKQWNNRQRTEWIFTKSSSTCTEGERVKSSTHTTWSANGNELTIQTTANIKVTPILNIVSIVSSTSNFHTGSSQNAPKMMIFNFLWKISNDLYDYWRLNMSKVSIITGVTAWDNARRVALVFLLSFTAAFLAVFNITWTWGAKLPGQIAQRFGSGSHSLSPCDEMREPK